MKTYFTCYADENYENQQEEILKECNEFDYKVPYKKQFLIDSGFYEYQKHSLTSLKNGGCVWKPYIILDLFLKIDPGDLLVYFDCGDKILPGYLSFIKSRIRQDTFFITSNFVNRYWTKTFCFKYMECNEDKYKDTLQLDAGQIGFIKSPFTESLLQEWNNYCSNYLVLLDDPLGERDDHVIRHSRDQSILTNLQVKYNIPASSINEVERKYTIHNYRG
jgi:hypothetical protein